MNKRTQILKKITSEKISNEIEPIAQIDLNTARSEINNLANDLVLQKSTLNNLIEDQIKVTAGQLKIKEAYLKTWLGNFSNAPVMSQFSLLRLIECYGLDPFLEEIDLIQYEDQSWQAVITTQGYARLLNACPQFKGIHYAYSEPESSTISAWIECAIYRTDREGPITVREYYLEAKRDTIAWQKMPRRMLRNRAFQQCAKMALGI